MIKKRIQPTTCFYLGLAGAVLLFIAGILMAAGGGQASFVRVASFTLFGGMLLFLSVTENGDEKRPTRTKLLLLFIALIVSYFNLPPLSNLVGALVIPFLYLIYRQTSRNLPLFALLLSELALFLIQMFSLVHFWGNWNLQINGAGLMLVSLARFWVLFILYRQFQQLPPRESTNKVNRLR